MLDAVIKNKSGQSIINPEFVEMVIRWMIQPQYERIRLENARFNNVNEGIPLTKEIIIRFYSIGNILIGKCNSQIC